MSLLNNAFEDFVCLAHSKVDDNSGGYTTEWTDGATIQGAMVFENSQETKTGHEMRVASDYSFITRKNVILNYHDVLRRKSDNKIFRITSDGDDLATPSTATLDMRLVSAEEWKLE